MLQQIIGFWCSVWCWKLSHAVVRCTLSRSKCFGHGCADRESRRLWDARCYKCSAGRWVLRLSCRRGKLSRGIVLLHDNARPHTARQTQALLREQFHWDIFEHPPYSPDLALSDFFLFPKWRSTLLINASQMMKTWRMLVEKPGGHMVWRGNTQIGAKVWQVP